MTTPNTERELGTLVSKQAMSEIDQWVEKYPAEQKQSAVMAALRVVQDENNGYLTQELMDAVAHYLEMPRIAVYEVASFYSMYEHEPVGKHKICVCNSVSCMLNSSESLIKHLENKLGVKVGEVTSDGRFSIKKVECLGACIGAPAVMIGKKYYENLTPEKIDKILDTLK
jgi:NADH-quinone oxidoreductase subunit E